MDPRVKKFFSDPNVQKNYLNIIIIQEKIKKLKRKEKKTGISQKAKIDKLRREAAKILTVQKQIYFNHIN